MKRDKEMRVNGAVLINIASNLCFKIFQENTIFYAFINLSNLINQKFTIFS